MSTPADLTAQAARRQIGARDLSPVDLAKACIARVEAVDPAVNALVARDFDRLLEDARAAEAAVMRGAPLGPLHGLPVAIKDMVDVAGLPTTFGSEIFADTVAMADAPMVSALRAAGALILGKTNVPEWSAGANTRNRVYGVTANPYDLTKSCAGSSGGSAVALATGMAPLATGSDLGGSLRNPAAYCAVVGFRPSPGVVPAPAAEMALLPFSTGGPMARTVADTALLLSVQSQADARDPWSRPADAAALADLPRPDLSRLRFAATEDFGFAPTERNIRMTFANRVAKLSAHLAIREDTPPCPGADRIFAVLRSVAYLGAHRDRLGRFPEKVGPNVRVNVEEGLGYSARDVAGAMAAQAVYHRGWTAYFEEVDYVLSPAVTVSPRDWHELYPAEIDGRPTRSYYHWLALAYATTIAGCASITIPCGLDPAGMPFGLQIVGRRHEDVGVLAVAGEIEALIAADPDLCRRPPDLDALAAAPPLREADGFLTL